MKTPLNSVASVMARVFYLVTGLAVAPLVDAVSAETVTVNASEDWCSAINKANPGDEVVLASGIFAGPCSIRVSGSEGKPVVVRGENPAPEQRTVLVYPGSSSNVVDLRRARHLVLRGLDFAHTARGVDAIKIHASSDILIESCTFRDIGGISISTSSKSSQRIVVRGNEFRGLRATGMYFGCHDGDRCQATGVVIERNYITGVTAPDGEVGYGLQLKLNSYGVVRDNTIYDTKGPGIMVYGSNRGERASLVEGNYVEGSRNDGGIVVGGGPVIVRNNVTVRNALGGIIAQDYGRRGLQQNVWIVHNTVFDNRDSGISVENWTARGANVLANNAIASHGEVPGMVPEAPSGNVTGNLMCVVPDACFNSPETLPFDLTPVRGGPLVDAGGYGTGDWRPRDDFMGVPRVGGPDVGAFEFTGARVLLGGGLRRPPRNARYPRATDMSGGGS